MSYLSDEQGSLEILCCRNKEIGKLNKFMGAHAKWQLSWCYVTCNHLKSLNSGKLCLNCYLSSLFATTELLNNENYYWAGVGERKKGCSGHLDYLFLPWTWKVFKLYPRLPSYFCTTLVLQYVVANPPDCIIPGTGTAILNPQLLIMGASHRKMA